MRKHVLDFINSFDNENNIELNIITLKRKEDGNVDKRKIKVVNK